MLSVRDRLNAGEFKNTVPYPTRAEKPRLKNDANANEVREYADKLEIFENRERAYNDARLAFNKGEMEALAADYELIGHPKRNRIWAMAWENGHSGGHSDVIYWYDELAELVL